MNQNSYLLDVKSTKLRRRTLGNIKTVENMSFYLSNVKLSLSGVKRTSHYNVHSVPKFGDATVMKNVSSTL